MATDSLQIENTDQLLLRDTTKATAVTIGSVNQTTTIDEMQTTEDRIPTNMIQIGIEIKTVIEETTTVVRIFR